MLGGDPPLLSQTTSPIITDADEVLEGHYRPMRWKLLIITSLVAALVNAAGMRALAYWMMDGATHAGASPLPGALFVVMAVPLLFITLACIFVYRHTARRRKLQAALTALFTLVLTFAALFASRMFLNL